MAQRYSYQWSEWRSGKTYRLRKDVHYGSVAALRSAAQAQALRHDGRFRIWQEARGWDDVMLLRWVPNVKPPPDNKGFPLDASWITRIIKLTHPDKHPIERKEEATAVTARLNALKDEIREREKRGY